MCQPENIILTQTSIKDDPDSRLRCSKKLGLGILETCREAHAVAERSLYRNNAFVLDGTCAPAIEFLESIPKRHLSAISDIRLTETTVTDSSAAQERHKASSTTSPLSLLLQLILDEMKPTSVTIPIWRDYGVAADEWYRSLGAAVYQRRLPTLRFHHLQGRPEERNLKGLSDLYHAIEIFTEYRFAVDDHIVWRLRKRFYDMSLGRDPAQAPRPAPAALRAIRERLDRVLWFQMRLYAFTMEFEAPEVGEEGLVVVMRYDLCGAKRRIRELEDVVREGFDYDRESRELFPLRLMSAEERLVGARESLERYEAIAEKGVWPVLDRSLWY